LPGGPVRTLRTETPAVAETHPAGGPARRAVPAAGAAPDDARGDRDHPQL